MCVRMCLLTEEEEAEDVLDTRREGCTRVLDNMTDFSLVLDAYPSSTVPL